MQGRAERWNKSSKFFSLSDDMIQVGGLPVLPSKQLSIFEFYICRSLSNHQHLAQQTMNCFG